jgi:phage baseplate assembly protein W
MPTIITKTNKRYKDLDLSLTIHPVRKDVNKLSDERAIIQSIKTLLLTKHYERPFNPDFGSNINKLLFEPLDPITAVSLKREIEQTVKNYEPRVSLQSVIVKPDFDNNAFSVSIIFIMKSLSQPITIQFFLARDR